MIPMLNISIVCSKCKQETLLSDNDGGFLKIDFSEQRLEFVCPKCHKPNELCLDVRAKKKLAAPFPKIGGSRL